MNHSMTWADFYLICFAVGFCFSFFSFVLGSPRGHFHFPHAHGHVGGADLHTGHASAGHGTDADAKGARVGGGHVSPLNPPTVAAFLAWFGGTGYLLTRYSTLEVGAQFLEVTKRQQAQADKAYDIQTNIMQQQVIAEQVKVQQIEKEQQVKVQEAEINRREKELIATVLKPAEIDRQRIETLAAAEKQRLIAEAEGQASSIRAQGEAESEIIFKKGEAEAKAMNVKAEAYQEYNQAAVLDRLFAAMPEIVKALASPLANVDKITIVSTGNGDASGMNKITGDMAKMAAQVPALFETLSGMPLSELLGKVRQIGDKTAKPAADAAK